MADDVSRTVDFMSIQLYRSYAINAYASLEQSLCRLFAQLLGTTFEFAAIVFYRITNTHSRNRIIEELLNKRHGSAYEAYWNGIPNTPYRSGLASLIRQLDQTRNEIVHWHLSTRVEQGTAERFDIALMKPAAIPLAFDTTQRAITTSELEEFILKANFVGRSLNMFFLELQGGFGPQHPMHATWREIFAQPASYPPPDTNPLSRNWKAPETPPQSSSG